MEKQHITCQFCSKNCDGKLKPIEGSLEEMLDTLLLKMNSAFSESPFICTSCEDVLNRCFEFKSTCLFMQTNIISNIDIDNGKANSKGVADLKDLNTCSLCMAVSKNCSFISLDNTDEDMLNQVFERCIPELDLSIIMKPTICKACYEHLQIYFNVMRNCSSLEKSTMDDKCLMSPQGVEKHRLSGDVCKENENNAGVIKIEGIFCEEIENEFDNKDYMEMEDTKSIDVLKFTSENMLTGINVIEVDGVKTEGIFCEKLENKNGTEQSGKGLTALQAMHESREIYEANEIKVERMICEEKEIKFDRKNYMEMEDTKFLEVLQFKSINVTCNGGSAADGIKTEGTFCEKLEMKNEVKREIFLVDHKLNNVQQFSSKHALKCEEEGNENFTETDDEKYLPYNSEKIEIVLMDKGNFDSLLQDPLKPVTNEISETRKCLDLLPQVSKILSTSNEEYKNYCGRPQNITEYPSKGTEHKNLLFKSAHKLSNHKVIHKNSTEKEMFRCNFCSFHTIHKGNFTRHSLKHGNPSAITTYQCKSCTFKAKTRLALRSHKLIHKKESVIPIYQCAACSFQARNKEALELHNLIHKDLLTDKNNSIITIYQCESCSYQAKSKYKLKNHLLVHKGPSEIKMYQCDHCPFQTKYRSSFSKHSLGHNEKNLTHALYQCDFCSFKSAHKLGLSNHKLIHKNPTEKEVFRCDYCSFQTIYKRAFSKHSSKHENPSAIAMYQCNSCTFKAKTRSALRNHKSIHKKELEITIYQCAACSYQTRNKSALEIHKSIHKDLLSDKNNSTTAIYQCETCSYQAKSKYQLEYHSLVHKEPSEVAMFQCESCSYQTKRKGSMVQHVLIHKNSSNIRIYRCDHCPFQTKYKSCISKHLLGHNVKKMTHFRYQCDLCSFKSINKSGLSNHKLIHKKELFHCDSCSFQTIYKSAFARHYLKHKNPSAIMTYQCSSCTFKGTSKTVLRNHKFMHHDVKRIKMYCCASCQYQTNNKNSIRKHEVTHSILCQFCSFSAKNKEILSKHLLCHEKHFSSHKDQAPTRKLSTYSNSRKIKSVTQVANCFLLASTQNPPVDPRLAVHDVQINGKQGL